MLSIHAKQLKCIHANAFNGSALRDLLYLSIIIERDSVDISADAFQGMSKLKFMQIKMKGVGNFPTGLFDPIASSISKMHLFIWPDSINLNEMFSNEVYRMLKVMDIRHVQLPQRKFLVLAATNFTAFRRVHRLILSDCGIETIQEHAFDAIARTLEFIYLGNNWIKRVTVAMFRSIFESKRVVKFAIHSHKVELICACDVIEVDIMWYPYREQRSVICLQCKRPARFDETVCGIHRDVYLPKFCIDLDVEPIMRIVNIRMAHVNGIISIQTNFTSTLRVIVVNLNGTNGRNCRERASKRNMRCMKTGGSMKKLDLHSLNGLLIDGELISITVIPIIHQFGARPGNMITVRQPFMPEKCLYDHCIWTKIIPMILCVILGICCGITCVLLINKRCTAPNVSDANGTITNEHEHYYDVQNNCEQYELSVCVHSLNDVYGAEYYEHFERTPDALPNEYF